MQRKLTVCVISHKRADKIPAFYSKEWIYIVGKDEAQDYVAKGFTNTIEGGGLCESRNRALEIGKELNTDVLQLSDDLGQIRFGVKDRNKVITLDKLIEIAHEMLIKKKYKILGISPAFNSLNLRKSISDGFVIGDFTMTSYDNTLRYDENLKLKEDYDFSLQNLQEYGHAPRMGFVIADFRHYTNEGGAVDYRNDQREQETIKYLKDKWGEVIKDNPNRLNEILIDPNYKYSL